MNKMAEGVKLMRCLMKEFRILGNGIAGGYVPFSWRLYPAYEQLVEEFKFLKKPTDKKVVKKHIFEGQLYLQYIQSSRKERELGDFYKGKGERPLEEVAARVGLKLPEKYHNGQENSGDF